MSIMLLYEYMLQSSKRNILRFTLLPGDWQMGTLKGETRVQILQEFLRKSGLRCISFGCCV